MKVLTKVVAQKPTVKRRRIATVDELRTRVSRSWKGSVTATQEIRNQRSK